MFKDVTGTSPQKNKNNRVSELILNQTDKLYEE